MPKKGILLLKDLKDKMVKNGDVEAMNFFELSVISAMPDDVYDEIKRRIGLALTYLEDEATNTATIILREFLKN
ncbi:MAG: hypothetical protein LBK62_01895 [Treponema sp.]|jgi:hypothetical protein|nr:hypothetical protein [Treponema sp.]